MANKYTVIAPNGFNVNFGTGENYKHGQIVLDCEDLARKWPRIFMFSGTTEDHVEETVKPVEELETEVLNESAPTPVLEEGQEMLTEILPPVELKEGEEKLTEKPSKRKKRSRK